MRGDDLWRFGHHVREIEDAEDHLRGGELLEDQRVEPRLRGFDRDLFGGGCVEFGEEGVAVRVLVDNRGVTKHVSARASRR